MSIRNYINKNKIGGLVLIIVIIIAFGFGGFGGGFLSNNQNNIAKIDKSNITTQDLINHINQTGIDQKAIQDNLENNIIEELLSGLISKTLLDLEVKDFHLQFSENSLSKRIKYNNNFTNENGVFERVKYEKFLLENNVSAPIFEKRLKERELQKKLFDFIGSGTVPPKFLVKKLFKDENRKMDIDFINLENFYKKDKEITEQELSKFIDDNADQLEVEYIDIKYAIVNPQNLIGINEFNQEFFDKIDEIENDILNGIDFNEIIAKFDLKIKTIFDYRFSNNNETIENEIYKVKESKLDIFEYKDDFIFYDISNEKKQKPNLNDKETKEEILKLILQKYKFDYNKNLLEQIKDKKFVNSDFIKLGKDDIQSLTLNSINDNKKFEINSVKMLYSLPENTITLINDEENKIYLARIKNYKDEEFNLNNDEYKSFFNKESTRITNSILKSYDFLLNDKYKVNINQLAINNVKNLFQ